MSFVLIACVRTGTGTEDGCTATIVLRLADDHASRFHIRSRSEWNVNLANVHLGNKLNADYVMVHFVKSQ